MIKKYVTMRQRREMKKQKRKKHLICAAVIVMVCLIGLLCSKVDQPEKQVQMESIPGYTGTAYVEINQGKPYFTQADISKSSYESYSELDALGRCGAAVACLSKDTMPTEERGEIGMVKPSGWHTIKYPEVIDDLYLYNRCHLIGYQLSGENANEKNLITGTRYMNVEGMLPFENEVAAYIRQTGNHVLYRVTPVFEENNLVANGVLMEAYSIEDSGKGISFCVFVFNVQPGIEIDYATGNSTVNLK